MQSTGAQPVCPGCQEDYLPVVTRCRACALKVVNTSTTAQLCGNCLVKGYPADASYCVAEYDWPLSALIASGKYAGQRHVLRALGEVLCTRLTAGANGQRREWPSAILPIPLHDRRLRERGYNQATDIARPIGAQLGIDVASGVLVRHRDTPTQTALTAQARRGNMRDAFSLAPGANLPEHVALVDDVMTSGSTLAAARQVCRDAGAKVVEYWVIARASDRHASKL